MTHLYLEVGRIPKELCVLCDMERGRGKRTERLMGKEREERKARAEKGTIQ